MDTRAKILNPARAVEVARELRHNGAPAKLVTGYFDVLLPEHAERLDEIAADGGHRLMVAVLDPPNAILAPQARAELVAALAVVDYVVLAGSVTPRDLLEEFNTSDIVHEEEADRRRTRGLIEHVQRRHDE